MKQLPAGEFSVWWWDADGGQHEELRFVSPEAAIRRAGSLIHGPSSILGLIQRVIITDGGDCTNFEWVKGKGIIFPKGKEMLQ